MESVKLQSIHEACEQLGIKPPTLRAWLQQRRLPYIKLGRRVLIDPADVAKFVRDNRVEAVNIRDDRG